MANLFTALHFRKLLFWAVLVVAFSLGFVHNGIASPSPPIAQKAVLDLRDWDFQANGKIEIAGEWAFYWNQFVDPTKPTDQLDGFSYIQVPGTWLGYEQDGSTLGKYGFATYRLKILLPENPQNLGLYLLRVQDAYRVYVNGHLWMHAGKPEKDSLESVAKITREYSSLKDVSSELNLVIHIANHSSYAGGGFFNSFTIGPEKTQYFTHIFNFSQDIFLSGALLCLGIFLVTLHIGRFREKAYFVLYVMSFAAAIYVITANAALIDLFPGISYHWAERLAYVSGTFLLALTYEFIHQVNQRKISHALSTVIMYLAGAIAITVVLWPKGLPVELIYTLAGLLLIVSISCIIEVRYVLVNKIQGGRLAALGTMTLVVAGAHDLLHANGLIQSIYLGQFGILMLMIFYAAILAMRVNTSITQNERLAKAIWSMNDSVAIFDSRDQAVLWNDAYWQHLSKPAQKALKPGTAFIDLVRADAFSGELENATNREQSYIRERMLRHYNPGETFEMQRKKGWYLYREAETPDGGRVTLATDLSSQKVKEAELKKAFEELLAANEAKNSFLSNMSHELRTPLNAIIGFSDMMSKQVLGPLSNQYTEYAGNINRSGLHLLRLVTDMLDIVRIETGKLQVTPEVIGLTSLLEDCLQMEMEKITSRNLMLEKRIPENIPAIYADPVRVRQIVLNLLDNAIKFTEEGGKITIIVETTEENGTAIIVQDTGIGIAKEDLKTALQKFGQVRQSHMNAHEGLGLGLTITQILMHLHGGKLELESELGKGTRASVTFPSQQEALAFFEKPTPN